MEERMAVVDNAETDNMETDLKGWKTRDLTMQEPPEGVEKAEPDNARKYRKGGKRRNLQALNWSASRPERGRIKYTATRRKYDQL